MPYFVWDIGMILVNTMQDLWEIHALLGSQLEDRQNTTGISSGADNYIRVGKKKKKTTWRMRFSSQVKIPTFIYMSQLSLSSAGMQILINLPEHKYLAPFDIL